MDENKNTSANIPEADPQIEAKAEEVKDTKEDFDEFRISDGFVIDESGLENIKPKSPKKKKKAAKIIIPVAVILVALSLAFGIVFGIFDFLGVRFSGAQKEIEITIDSGSTTAKIANELEECGAVRSSILFRIFVKAKNYDGKFRDGFHHFPANAGYEEIAKELMQNGASAKNVKVTVVEGKNVDEIAELLEKKGVCTKKDFLYEVNEGKFDYDFVDQIPVNQVYYRLEGYLFPDTYQFFCYDSKECAHLAVDKMLSNLNEKLNKEKIDINNITVAGKKYTFHEIMSLSSIVEMEASSNKTEMPKVAAVFFNRLRSSNFSTLGSSPTRKYPYGEGRYNTYEYPGIPVGPLCSPGIDAIKSTVSPKENFDYYYFVTDKEMKFYFRKTLSEHNAIIAKLKAENNWIYED